MLLIIDFSGVKLPFNVTDLLSSSMSIISILGGFILLGMAIIFTPHIIGLIKQANFENNNRKRWEQKTGERISRKETAELAWKNYWFHKRSS